MTDKEIQKYRNTEILTFEYLENEKSFLDEIKSIFHSFLKGYHLVEKKNSEHEPFNLEKQNFHII